MKCEDEYNCFCFDGVECEAEVLARRDEGESRNLADWHPLKDPVVFREITTSLRFFDAVSSKPPPIEILRCVEHLPDRFTL